MLLKIDNLAKKFGGLTAVNNLSLYLNEGGIHSLIGPNGSGKTTTINLISGVYPCDSGTMIYDEKQEISKLPSYEISKLGIRRTYQNIKLFTSMTLKENLMVGGHCETKAGLVRTIIDYRKYKEEEKMLSEKADHMLEIIKLKDKANELSNSQPYGVQKITELGIAMMTNPKIILLDEPAAGLNPSERAEFIKIVLQIRDEYKVKFLLVEHNMDVVMNVSERISVLNFGNKIAEGTPYEIQNNDEVIKAYLGRKFEKKKA